MSSDEPIEASAFMASFKGFMDQVVAHAPLVEEPIFLRRLREHVAAEPATIAIAHAAGGRCQCAPVRTA